MSLNSSFIRRLAVPLCAYALALASASVTRGQALVFSDFSSITNVLKLTSSSTKTTTADGTVIRLVKTTTNDIGGAFTMSQQTVTSGFSAAFDFRISNRGGITDSANVVGGDGFVFVLQNNSSSTLGGSGEQLGYGGILKSVGVEFDTYENNVTQSDLDSNHLGIDLNGSVNRLTTGTEVNVSPDFDNGQKWTAWVDYNGSTLEVRVSTNGVRPSAYNLSYAISSSTFQSVLGSTSAYVGFTAGTGGAYENIDIVDWTFSNSYISGGVTPGAAIPEPANAALMAGAVAIAGARLIRRRAQRIDVQA